MFRVWTVIRNTAPPARAVIASSSLDKVSSLNRLTPDGADHLGTRGHCGDCRAQGGGGVTLTELEVHGDRHLERLSHDEFTSSPLYGRRVSDYAD